MPGKYDPDHKTHKTGDYKKPHLYEDAHSKDPVNVPDYYYGQKFRTEEEWHKSEDYQKLLASQKSREKK